jgi:uncharacterized membrane protein YccC
MADLDVRVSDREREAVADTLREHAAEGRLDPEELEERLTAAYAARTRGDLAGLTTDLPQREPAPPPRPSVGQRVMPLAIRLAIVDLFCVGIWFLSGMEGSFWPGWVILVSALAVANRALHVVGRDARAANAGRTSHPARDRGRRPDRDRRR